AVLVVQESPCVFSRILGRRPRRDTASAVPCRIFRTPVWQNPRPFQRKGRPVTSLAIAQSTPTATAIGALVSRHFALGEPRECEFLRRSFNQVYELRFADGRRFVARLSSERPRGAPNIAYEAALLRHLRGRGIPVAANVPAANGEDA